MKPRGYSTTSDAVSRTAVDLNSTRTSEKHIKEREKTTIQLKRTRNCLPNASTPLPPEILAAFSIVQDGYFGGTSEGSYNFSLRLVRRMLVAELPH